MEKVGRKTVLLLKLLQKEQKDKYKYFNTTMTNLILMEDGDFTFQLIQIQDKVGSQMVMLSMLFLYNWIQLRTLFQIVYKQMAGNSIFRLMIIYNKDGRKMEQHFMLIVPKLKKLMFINSMLFKVMDGDFIYILMVFPLLHNVGLMTMQFLKFLRKKHKDLLRYINTIMINHLHMVGGDFIIQLILIW